ARNEDYISGNSAVLNREKLSEAVMGVDGGWRFVGKVVDCFAANEMVRVYYSNLDSAEKLLRAVYFFLPLSKIENRTLATDCKNPESIIQRENYILVPSSYAQPVVSQTAPTREAPPEIPSWLKKTEKTKKDQRSGLKQENKLKEEKDFVKAKKGEGLVFLDRQEATPGRYVEKFQEVVREAVEGVDWTIGWNEKYRLLIGALEKIDASGKASIMESSKEIQGLKRSLAPMDKLRQNIYGLSDTLRGVASLLASEWYNMILNDRCALFLYHIKNLTDGRRLERYLNREDLELGRRALLRIEEIKNALESLKKAEMLLKNIEEEINKVLSSVEKSGEWLARKQDEFVDHQKSLGYLDNFMGEKKAGYSFQKIPDTVNDFLRSIETKSGKVLNLVREVLASYAEVRDKLNELVENANELDNLVKKLRKPVENSLKIIEETQWDFHTLTEEEAYISTLYQLLEPITSQLAAHIRDAPPSLKNLQNIVNRGKNIYINKIQPLEITIKSVEELDLTLQK
ncbi:MAG: hypothetical protein KIH08_12435, partial [Candidatus Freyarchaeota archaeon]|nr:hypothetical protein [Candidatus Jordarchaeia archaeon]